MMKCRSEKKIDCGFWDNGLCGCNIKCQNQYDAEKTRYEKIKELTLDEIAEYIDKEGSLELTNAICLQINPTQDCDCENEKEGKCKDCIKKWLMMPVKEGNEHEDSKDN